MSEDEGWWFKFEDGKPIVRSYCPGDDWSEVPGDPEVLDAIYDHGYDVAKEQWRN